MRRTEEARRRAFALMRFVCPDHGCDLVEYEDIDEHGAHVFYRCPTGDHVFGSAHDTVGGYCPMDDEIGVLAIEVSRCENAGCGTGAVLDAYGECPRCGARS